MFTVKHINPQGGESLYEATEVMYSPADNRQSVPPVPETVWYQAPGTREIKSLNEGFVYVTNDTGATVAKYDLSDQPSLPHA